MPRTKRLNSQPVKCETCGITLNSEVQAQQHFSGKQHLKKLKGGISGSESPPKTGGAAALSQGEATGVVTGMPSNVPQGGATAVPSGGASAQQPSGSSGYTQHAQKDKSKLDPVSQAVYDNMLGKLPLKRKMEITCAVCETVFNSEVQADAHFKGGKHLKRLKMVEEMRKSLGGVTPSEAVKIQMETEEPAEKKANVGGGFFCNFCNIKVNSLEQLEAHRAGMAHRKVLERQAASQTKIHTTEIPGKQSGMFYCQICDISVPNAVGLKKHMSTLAHQDKQAGRQPKPDGPDNGAASATVAQPSSY